MVGPITGKTSFLPFLAKGSNHERSDRNRTKSQKPHYHTHGNKFQNKALHKGKISVMVKHIDIVKGFLDVAESSTDGTTTADGLWGIARMDVTRTCRDVFWSLLPLQALLSSPSMRLEVHLEASSLPMAVWRWVDTPASRQEAPQEAREFPLASPSSCGACCNCSLPRLDPSHPRPPIPLVVSHRADSTQTETILFE
eukprot:1700221-Amphidinium_carterae.1